MKYYSGGKFRLHQTSIKETNRMLENLGMSKPNHYPCIVLKLDYNKYYPLNLIISEHNEEVDPEHKVYRQIIFGGVEIIDSYLRGLETASSLSHPRWWVIVYFYAYSAMLIHSVI